MSSRPLNQDPKRKGKRTKLQEEFYTLHLLIANHTPPSLLAIANLHSICKERLAERCHIKIIDIQKNPGRAKRENIVALPTLIRRGPLPEKRVIGNLANIDRVLMGLGMSQG